MAEEQFNSKRDSGRKKREKIFPRLMGTLTLRILIVCLFLLVIPLLFYAFTMSLRDYRLQMTQLILELEALGYINECQIEKSVQRQLQSLLTVRNVVDFDELTALGEAPPEINEIFEQVAEADNFSGLYYIALNQDGGFTTIASLHPEQVGRKVSLEERALAEENYRTVLERGYFVFLGQSPWTGLKQMYVGLGIYSKNDNTTPIGMLASAVPAEELIKELKRSQDLPKQYDLALLNRRGEIFVSTDPELEADSLLLLDAHELTREEIGKFAAKEQKDLFFQWGEEKENYIGLKIPIEGAKFSLLIEVPEKYVVHLRNKEELLRFISLVAFIFLLGGLGTFWITRRFAKPLKSLTKVMEQVEQGDMNARFDPDPMGFEINVLGKRFNEMIDSLEEHIETAKNERVEKETLAKELLIGLDIQKTLLPSQMPEYPGVEAAAGFVPAKEVGGDFYDLYVKDNVDPAQLAFSIADASGKGVSACLYSLDLRTMLRSFDAFCDDLNEIVSRANNLFCQDTRETGMFVTAWLALYDPKKKLLHYSCAGHNPALLFRKDGSVEELTTKGIALGVTHLDTVETRSVEISSGDLLVLFTDGVVEAHDELMHLFGMDRLLKALHESKERPVQEIVDYLFAQVAEFSHGVPQHDDLTALILRFS